jgi:hypothetical protein
MVGLPKNPIKDEGCSEEGKWEMKRELGKSLKEHK